METPSFCSTAVIVKGSVAPDEEVEKAVSKGVDTALKCLMGLALPINFVSKGRVTNAWTESAKSTVSI